MWTDRLAWKASLFALGVAATLLASCIDPGESEAAATPASEVSAKVDKLVQSQMKSLGIHGASVAIIKDGRVRYSQAMGLADVAENGLVTERTLFEAASLSKVAFAYFALRELDRNRIDFDTPLARTLPHPDIKDERANRITARMVLTHQTGFPNWRWENADNTLNIRHEPGTAFGYSGEGFEYLALALAHANQTDKSGLEAIMRLDLEQATGCDVGPWTYSPPMANLLASGYVGDDQSDDWEIEEPLVSASLFTTARDYGCLLAAISVGKGLKTDTYSAMIESQVTLADDHDFRTDFGLDAWGLGVAIKSTRFGRALSHGGVNEGFTAWFTLLEDQGVGYVIFTNSEEATALNAAIENKLLALALEFE